MVSAVIVPKRTTNLATMSAQMLIIYNHYEYFFSLSLSGCYIKNIHFILLYIYAYLKYNFNSKSNDVVLIIVISQPHTIQKHHHHFQSEAWLVKTNLIVLLAFQKDILITSAGAALDNDAFSSYTSMKLLSV